MNALRIQRMPNDVLAVERQAGLAAVRRLYCECLPLWRSCPRGECRRYRRCLGNAKICLPRAWPLLPEAVQHATYALVNQGGPRRLPAATPTEHSLRRFPPTNFVG